ncbi:MAG: fibronectin type III domain-containing protein [Jatrophihabitantaceae bacterium]
MRVRGVALAAAVLAVVSALAAPAARATIPPVQTAPGAPVVTGITMNSAALSWTRSTDPLGIVGYRVYRQASGGTDTLIATTDGGITRYTAKHLYASTAYAFRVVALDTAGHSTSSPPSSFTTAANTSITQPAAPSDTSVAAHAFSDTRVDVSWGGSPPVANDVAGYQVLRDGVPIVGGRVDLPGGLRYSDNGLAPGTMYTYTIEAIDSAGNVSAATLPKAPAKATTLATGTVRIARGPYVSNVTPTAAIVSWWTNIPSAGELDYGTGAPSTTVTDGTTTHHKVTITGLVAGATYNYTVGTSTVRSTPVATFRTAAPAGSPFSFAAIGDFGGASPGETQNGTNIASAGTSFIQTLGDNIYPSAGIPDPNFATTNSDFDGRFFKQFGTALRNQAFFPANGNQEYYSNGAFWDAFPMPGMSKNWYGYDWGDAHISVLDSELSFVAGSTQYNWLQADLAAHQSAVWRIVVIQRPPYSSSSTTSGSTLVQKNLVPLFQQNRVALVLSGNSHNYERTHPLVNGNVATGGITYVVSGGGGNGHNSFTIAAPAWSALRDSVRYEYTKVSVTPTALTVEAIDAATNTVFDSTTLAVPPTAPGAPTIGAATRNGFTAATVRWTAPASDGRSPITGYTATAAPGGRACTAASSATSCTVTGLTGGTAYTFTARATNVVGTGAASAASNPVTALIPVRLTIVAPASTTVGTPITVSGRLTRADNGAAVSNSPVRLQYRRFGSTAPFITVGTRTTSTSGVVAVPRVYLGRTLQFRLWAPPTSVYQSTLSPMKNVTALRRVTIARSARLVATSRLFWVTGRVSPTSAGRAIFLQRRVGASWRTVGWKPLSRTSTYAFGLRSRTGGTFVYRTFVRHDQVYGTSVSGATAIAVR